MSDPDPWAKYARLQQQLSRRDHVDDRARGLEAALDRHLQDLEQPAEALQRAARSAARKNRAQARQRRSHGEALRPDPVDPRPALEARLTLHQVKRSISAVNWFVICSLAAGYGYRTIAAQTGVGAGTLRVRVVRVRAELRRRFGY